MTAQCRECPRHSIPLSLLLLGQDGIARRAGALPHDGVLARHPPVEGALELGAQGELAEVGRLLLVQDDALLAQGLVLHAVEALLDVADLGRGAVGRADGGRHAVGAVADRGASLFRGGKRDAVVS